MKRAIQAVLAVVVMLAALVGWYVFETRSRLAEKRAAAKAELPELIAQRDRDLGSELDNPRFAKPDGEDAGPWLNPRLVFEQLSNASSPLLSAPCQQLMRDFSQREDQAQSDQVAACDTSALTELRRFGPLEFHRRKRASQCRRVTAHTLRCPCCSCFSRSPSCTCSKATPTADSMQLPTTCAISRGYSSPPNTC